MIKKFPRYSIPSHLWGPLKIAGSYFILGALWIIFSDQIAANFAPDEAALARISTYKGWGFVLVTASLLYLLIHRHTTNLLDNQNRLRLITDALPALISYVDATGHFRFTNKAYRDWFGENANGKSVEDVFGKETYQKIIHHKDSALAGQKVNYETSIPHKNGGERFVNASYIPDVDANGITQGFYSLVQDVTIYKISEEALVRSESRYRSLFENMASGLARCQMLYDENGKPNDFIYLDVNGAFKYTTGLSDVLGKRVTELIPDIHETNPEIFEHYGRVALTGKPEKFESFLPNLGSGTWFSVSAYSPEKNFFVSVFEIITERKQAEDALRQAEARFRTLVEQTPAVTYTAALDETSTTLYVSPQIEDFIGIPSDEYLSRLGIWSQQLHPDDRERVLEQVHRSHIEGGRFESEYRMLSRDNHVIWVHDIADLVRDESGNDLFLQGIMMDITDRKRTEELLEQSHRQLFSFVEQAPLSIAMFDRNMNYLATSRLWVSEYGRGHTDLIGLNHYEVHPDIPEYWKEAHQKGLAGISSRNDDDLWEQADGTKNWLRWAINPWTNESGEVGGIIISTENITERKSAEVAAYQNEVRYHRVLDAMLEGCQIIDFEWRYVYVNEVVTRHGKRKPEELLGHTMMEMYPGIEQTELFTVLQKCMADREPTRLENRFDFPDGSMGWFELSIQPAQEGLFILSTDIAERKQAERYMEESKAKLDAALESMTDAVSISDNEGNFINFNEAFAAFHKFKSKEDCSRTLAEYPDILDVFMDTGEPAPVEMWAAHRALRGEIGTNVEYSLLRKDTGDAWVGSYSFAPIRDTQGSITGSVVVGRDITKQKQAEEEIIKLNDELEQRVFERTSQLEIANKELEAFSYSVSHDLRAPLRAIDGFTNILMEDYESSLDEEGKRLCNVISRESKRMGVLIDDLLAFSRLSRREMSFNSVDMQTLVNSVFDELCNGEDGRLIDFRPGKLPSIEGDEALLRQVWTNLLANAFKFTSRKERAIIEVGSIQNKDETIYYVRDNGAGFDMEYVGKLFGVFQRLHSDSEFEGTGVGLAIVQRVIHRHGGRVWAEGITGEGAIFHFAIPQKEEHHE